MARRTLLKLETLNDRIAPAAGALDPTFGGDNKVVTSFGPSEVEAYGVALQADGKIVTAGRTYNGSNYDFAVARYSIDGTLDTSFDGEPGVGDLFFKWVNDVQWDESLCRRESITPHATRTFTEFPSDPALEQFDRSDRKYAALAKKCGRNTAVFNAADSDWKHHQEALSRNGVKVVNLCPADLKEAT